ncbi:MAG: sigma-70 family RNA polymerase sigma factor [Planctomycetaceae bacterium]
MSSVLAGMMKEADQLSDSTSHEPSDQSLLRRFQSGEQDAATRLYVRYAKRLQGLAKAQTGQALGARVDAEDIVQSVFRTFFRRAKEGHYQVPDDDELWKLLLVISLYKIRDAAVYHRAAKRDLSRTERLNPAHADAGNSAAEEQFEEATLRLVIEDLTAAMTASQRQIIQLRLDGTPVAEIADATKRSKRSVERTLQAFRELLKKELDEEPGR